MSGRLTTHVLDLSEGKPAIGMRIQLFALLKEGTTMLLKDALTNHDGRLEQPLLEGESLKVGLYELLFWAGDYFGSSSFLERIPVRFKVTDVSAHYHVPLLAAPGGYSTYRGS